ncbi:hypothetical protein IE81DRAFT_324801 [Ceraceosorus guamensis]|uniref:Uncharacterized protein n=1 Tax=Ceraceosorus guamensis TaxID=1522189 RepID=A0A316VW67_9BASI|nr:hypothetical protein IE81DRAFT_324801 [Ceraceosorus guamensis]PWN41188.1 hypothetical protein IE81DRAFT_324801 [Ceraceosorus guamensis]
MGELWRQSTTAALSFALRPHLYLFCASSTGWSSVIPDCVASTRHSVRQFATWLAATDIHSHQRLCSLTHEAVHGLAKVKANLSSALV